MQMKQQVAQMKMAGCMKTSTEVMKSMQNLIRIPELQKVTQDLSKEMVKAGIIDEMINDSTTFSDRNSITKYIFC
jgi:charged multivesicular body protein 3